MTQSIAAAEIKTIIMACEAGMGSSLMVVNTLKKKLKTAKISGVNVIHKPARAVPEDAQIVVVHQGLANVVRRKAPNAVVVTFSHFLNDPVFDKLVQAFVENSTIQSNMG